jgi:CRP-like cAMP-binding protein/rhodanese-related sulfurtransferase
MENENNKEEPRESTVFAQLSQEKWDELTRVVEHRVVSPGTIIVKQEDPGDRFYIIRSGRVRVYRRDTGGLEMELSLLGAGESFGEMALLTGQERSANVEALEETHLMVLSKEQFDRILSDYPHVSRAFLRQMSERVLRDEKIIEKGIRQRYLSRQVSWPDFLLIIGVSIVLALVFNQSNPNGVALFPKSPDRKAIPEISVASAMEQIKKGGTIIVDSGPEGFYQRKHIGGAISVPLSLSDLLYEITFLQEHKGKKIIVYGGTFSKLYDWELAERLLRRGQKDVKVLAGGIAAWEKAGYPVDTWQEKE